MEPEKIYPFLQLDAVTAPYREELIDAAKRVINSGWYIGGPEVESLESELSDLLTVPFVVGVSNGLDALRLTLRSWIELHYLRKGQGVVVPANTFIASVLAIVDAGLVPVFAEPDIVTMNLSGITLGKAIADNPDIEIGAVMTVHLYGRVAWDEDMRKIIESEGLLVIEDTAQAIGARSYSVDGLFGSKNAGTLGHAGCFSFYPTKNVGALGDAGAVVTHDRKLATMVKTLANYGADRRYHNEYCGYNCRIDPLQAALIRVKLAHMEEENSARRVNADTYNQIINHPHIKLPLMPSRDCVKECVWHQYVIRSPRRNELQEYLKSNGVMTDIHYPVACSRQPCIERLTAKLFPGKQISLPVAEKMSEEVLSLPVSSATSASDVREIAEIINCFE